MNNHFQVVDQFGQMDIVGILDACNDRFDLKIKTRLINIVFETRKETYNFNQSMTCDVRPQITEVRTMCSSKSRCVCGTHYSSDLQCACVLCNFRLAKCDQNIAHFWQ